MAAHHYSFGELETLWRQAGGPAKVAPIMAAIALAESGGNPRARHHNANGTTDRGLWQINSSHRYSAASSFSPKANARQAVAVYRSQGLRAWSTYTSGAYRSHLENQVTGGGGFGVLSPGNFAGVDQGVDYRGAGLIPALDSIRITSVRKVSIIEGGTWPLVGFRYTSGPHKGRYGYVMENFLPLVKPGQRLKRGQPIGRAIGSYPYIEYGFASGPRGDPLAPLGNDPHAPTQAGQSMLAYIEQRAGSQVKPLPGAAGGGKGGGGGTKQSSGGGQGAGVTGSVTSAVTSAVTGLGSSIGQAGHDIAAPFETIASTGESVTSFLGHLVDPHFWLRALEVVGGVVLVLLGLYLLARQAGVAQPVEDAATVLPVGRAARLSEGAAAEMQFSPGRSTAARRPRRRSVPAPGYEPNTRRRELAARAQPSDEIPF